MSYDEARDLVDFCIGCVLLGVSLYLISTLINRMPPSGQCPD